MSRTARLTPLVWLLGLGACTSILGIDDLHEGPRPGGGGDAATNAGNGNDSAGEGTTGGKLSAAGTSNTVGGKTAQAGAGGAAGDAGAAGGDTLAGAGPQGGAANSGSTVHGHVIDFWGHAVPNIPVQIGDVLGGTDENGDFVFEDVPDTYDVSMVYDHSYPAQSDAWVYQGLTRRDPTLQMYWGTEERTGHLDVKLLPKPAPTAAQTIWVALGGADGADNFDDADPDGYLDTYVSWFGPDTTTQTAHALLWQRDGNDLPTSYLAYDESLLALSEATKGSVTLDLTKSTIDSANIQGTVTSTGAGSRYNDVFLRFTSNAAIHLLSDSAGPNSFSYLLPSIPNSSLTVAATRGSSYEGIAIVHTDGLAPGAKPKFTIPALPTLQSPAGGLTSVVPSSTKFSFQSTAKGPFVLEFYSQNMDDSAYQAIYIVTAQKTLARFPTIIGDGFKLYADTGYEWAVATHGTFASVDEMASEGGFLDEFSRNEETAQGPRNVSGEFVESVYHGFTTAP